MKNLIKLPQLFILCLVICFFTACTEKVEVVVTKEEKEAIEKKKNKAKEDKHLERYELIILDGCEYYRTGGWSDAGITHKGNCNNPIHNCNCR